MKGCDSIVILGVLLLAFVNQAKAYLPPFDYVEGQVTRSGEFISWRGNKGTYMDSGYHTVTEITDVIIEGGKYEIDEVYEKGGPIRYYYEAIMPRVPGEPLYIEMCDESVKWSDRNLPTNSPNMKIWKATTRAMEYVVREQERSVNFLWKYRNEIGRLHNEYVRYGVDTRRLDCLCEMYRKILTDSYWRELKKSSSRYNGRSMSPGTMDFRDRQYRERDLRRFRWGSGGWGVWGFLSFGCDFDVEVAKAYEPLIDARIFKYRQSLGAEVKPLDPSVQKKIDELEREVKKANRKAREADGRAVQAIQEAEEAKRLNRMNSSNPEDRWLIRHLR